MNKIEKSKLGKKARASGKRFEGRVKEVLQKEGWIVVRWDKNVEFDIEKENRIKAEIDKSNEGMPLGPCELLDREGKLINTKPKFNPFTRNLMMMSGGFPDYLCFKMVKIKTPFGEIRTTPDVYDIKLVECKSIGYLSAEEKEKAKWIIDNLKILIQIAFKGKKKGEVIFEDFK